MSAFKTRTLDASQPEGETAAESVEVTALINRAKGGDPAAFDDLMRLYERRVILLGVHMGLQREDALDVCQETFVKVFRYLRRFRSGETFFKWLYRIAIHVIYDHMRKTRSTGLVSIDEVLPDEERRLLETPSSLERQIEAADLAAKLLAGMSRLTRQERIVFALRDLQEMSTAEIGVILRLSQITVRRHCASARQKLRQGLFSDDPERSWRAKGNLE